MSRNIIITEQQAAALMPVLLSESEGMSKSDAAAMVRDILKNDRQVKGDMEKKVREIVAGAVNVLFRTLWQRRNFYEDEIKRGN